MTLVPCEGCRRHIRDRELACPFCTAPRTPVARPVRVFSGRYSRAVAFAGLTACYTGGSQPAQSTTAAEQQPQHTMKPSRRGLHGKLTDARTGAPLAGVVLEAWASNTPITATTDANGDYAVELPAGDYTITFRGPDGTKYSTGKLVEIADGESPLLDLPIDRTPMPVAKPYGAPPARRRTV